MHWSFVSMSSFWNEMIQSEWNIHENFAALFVFISVSYLQVIAVKSSTRTKIKNLTFISAIVIIVPILDKIFSQSLQGNDRYVVIIIKKLHMQLLIFLSSGISFTVQLHLWFLCLPHYKGPILFSRKGNNPKKIVSIFLLVLLQV